MLKDDRAIVILITCGNEREAENITDALLGRKLIACGNIVPEITSLFRWEGKITRDNEVLLIAKSRKALIDEVIKTVTELHSYSTPEIIALPIIAGSIDYLDWLFKETSAEAS